MEPEEFVQKVTTALNNQVGVIIASSILKNNLGKFKKDVKTFTHDDCRGLVSAIVKAVSVFETQGEAKQVQAELEKILKEL